MCRELGIRPIGGNYRTIKACIKEYNLDTSHFTGKGWNVGSRFRPIIKAIPDEEVFIENSTYKSTSNLRIRLLRLREHKCECCNNTTWNGKDIPLEVHHINGINTDNRLENLKLLCPNCHALTDNYRGRGRNLSALSEMREVEYHKFKETLTGNADGNLEPSPIREGAETRHDKPKSKKLKIIDIPQICGCCGEQFYARRKQKYCSQECAHNKISKRPNVFELLDAFKEYKNFLQVSKHYNVSDNAVRKWCILYGILDMVKE